MGPGTLRHSLTSKAGEHLTDEKALAEFNDNRRVEALKVLIDELHPRLRTVVNLSLEHSRMELMKIFNMTYKEVRQEQAEALLRLARALQDDSY